MGNAKKVLVVATGWGFGALALVGTTTWGYIAWGSVHSSTNWTALFGDSFGVVNAVVSFLAFGGMLAALSLQRKELAETRMVLKDQADVQEKQRAALVEANEAQREANRIALLQVEMSGLRTVFDALNKQEKNVMQQAMLKPSIGGSDRYDDPRAVWFCMTKLVTEAEEIRGSSCGASEILGKLGRESEQT